MSFKKQLLVAPTIPAQPIQLSTPAGFFGLGGIAYGLNPDLLKFAPINVQSTAVGFGLAVLHGLISMEPRFSLDAKFAEKASSEGSLTTLRQVVEDSASKFVEAFALPWRFEFSIPEDPELPRWERVILRIKLSGTPFEEALRLWDKIDAKVREALNKQADESDEPTRKKLLETQNRFFIELDLNE